MEKQNKESTDKFLQFVSKYNGGEILYREGDPQETFFIISKGKVQLKLESEDFILLTLSKGDFFGEESLNTDQTAFYTVEILEDSDIIRIPYPDLIEMMKKNSEIALKILKKLSEKNVKLEKMLLERTRQAQAIEAREKTASKEKTGSAKDRTAAEETKSEDQTSEKINPNIKASLVIQRSNRAVPLSKVHTYLGRRDYTTGFVPDIDLTEEDLEKYISRKHAKIFFSEGKFYVSEEPGAINGTFLNGNKLKTGVKYELKNSDEMTLCHLNILFKF